MDVDGIIAVPLSRQTYSITAPNTSNGLQGFGEAVVQGINTLYAIQLNWGWTSIINTIPLNILSMNLNYNRGLPGNEIIYLGDFSKRDTIYYPHGILMSPDTFGPAQFQMRVVVSEPVTATTILQYSITMWYMRGTGNPTFQPEMINPTLLADIVKNTKPDQ